MAIFKENKLSVSINGHDLTPALVSFSARVKGFEAKIDIEYLDTDQVTFEPMAPCARREKVAIEVRVGAREAVALSGIIECAMKKEVGEAHPISLSFTGELT